MPIRAFKSIPRTLVEWGKFFQQTEVTPSDGSVGEDQLQDGEVTFRKIQNITPDRLLGRDTSPAGQVQELEVSGGLEFTGTGIQRSALNGDIEADAGDSATRFRDGTARSVLGRADATDGALADIVAGADNRFLTRRSGTLSFDALTDADIPSSIARDSEVTSAISTHVADSDPHSQYTTAAELSTALSALNLASGTYTPTLTNTTNLDGSTAFETTYLRVGATVTVSGLVNMDPTAAAEVVLGMSLPVASNFASVWDCGGAAACIAVQQSSGIQADTANNRAEFRFIANDTSNRTFCFSFTYRVI